MPLSHGLQAPRRFPEGGIATGINADGKPEILGFDVTSAKDGHGRQPARRAIVQPGYDRRRLPTHCRSEPGFVAG
jgi:hypothetical protein